MIAISLRSQYQSLIEYELTEIDGAFERRPFQIVSFCDKKKKATLWWPTSLVKRRCDSLRPLFSVTVRC